jgi:single-strand DNA-binding protein
MNGRLFLNAYNNHDGEAKATLNAHINTIKVHHSSSKGSSENAVIAKASSAELLAPLDDLPF